MIDPVHELKIRAELLHHGVTARDASVVTRLRALPEYKRADEAELLRGAPQIRRKHCLAVVAQEAGFRAWEHAKEVLEGEGGEADFGELLYPKKWGAFLNSWFVVYEEAKQFRASENAYLLAYKRHYFVAGRGYIEAIGWDPDDSDWALLGWDWVRPKDPAARKRLYGKLLSARGELS